MNGRESCRVLVADSDPHLCSNLRQFFSKEGIATTFAADGRQALDLFRQMHPDAVIADRRLPGIDGFALLVNIGRSGSAVPVLITTAAPDISDAMQSIENGAWDYLVKPLQFPLLLQRVRKAVENTRLVREAVACDEILRLSDITNKLSATNNMDSLLDVIFRYGIELTGAQCGAIFLHDGPGNELVFARQRWPDSSQQRSSDDDAARCDAARWTFSSGRPLVIEGGASKPEAPVHPACGQIHSLMSVPLTASQKTMGVFLVERLAPHPPFSPLDFNRMEILALQAGIAINNVALSDSRDRKLDELKVIGAFSEQLMGRMDPYDLIRSLFEKVREYCSADIVGFLLVRQHRPEFLYWTRGAIDDVDLRMVCRGLIDTFNRTSTFAIPAGAVSFKQLIGRKKSNGPVRLPLAFQHFAPIAWDGHNLGIFFAGAGIKRPDIAESEPLLSSLVGQTRIALINSKLYHDMKENYLKTIKALAIAVDAKDNYTRGHSEKVMAIAEELAREVRDLDDRRVSVVRDAALLHDIGKIGIPGHILNKPGALTFAEFNGIMKKHSALGANIVKEVPFLQELYTLILHHHEHFDGSGYPEGLKGEEIPIGARILHLADAFDAMTSDRPYRSSLGNEEAVRRIVADSGKHFDPAIVGHFLRVAKRKGIIV